MEVNTKLNLKNDVIFQAFFAKKGNEIFLIDFLEALLKIRINKIEIKEEVTVEKLSKYEDMNKTIMINILGENMFPEKFDEYIQKSAIVLEKHREYIITDIVEWYFIELPKFRKHHPNMDEKINQWLVFIDDEDKELVNMAVEKKAEKMQIQEL